MGRGRGKGGEVGQAGQVGLRPISSVYSPPWGELLVQCTLGEGTGLLFLALCKGKIIEAEGLKKTFSGNMEGEGVAGIEEEEGEGVGREGRRCEEGGLAKSDVCWTCQGCDRE